MDTFSDFGRLVCYPYVFKGDMRVQFDHLMSLFEEDTESDRQSSNVEDA